MTGYYTVTVVSPMGVRDSYGVEAAGPGHARNAIAQKLLTERPGWRATVATLLYRIA